jgi:uncharacterized membrane protein YkvA (DUF1232 family)
MAYQSEMWRQYSREAEESDLNQIDDRIDSYKRGPIGRVWDKVMALWRYAKDPNAPWWGRALAIGALIYLVSPIDAVPDPIPVVGLLDDAAVIGTAVARLYSELRPYLRRT